MAKLAMLVAVVALSLAIGATASITITTVEVDDENPTRRCPRMPERMLSSCHKFVSKGCTCGCEDCQCQGIQMMGGSDTCGSQLKQCCAELKRMDDECMCKGIKSIVQKIQQQEQSFQGEDMAKQAMKMPSVCGITTKPCTVTTLLF